MSTVWLQEEICKSSGLNSKFDDATASNLIDAAILKSVKISTRYQVIKLLWHIYSKAHCVALEPFNS